MNAPQKTPSPRVLLVQWAGDYREAYLRFSDGGVEDYYAQRYSVAEAGRLAEDCGAYGVLCLTGSSRYDQVMPNGVRAIGAGLTGSRVAVADVTAQLTEFQPTHLVLTTPQLDILDWAAERCVDVLPQFADTFSLNQASMSRPRRWVAQWRHARRCRRLARLLNAPAVRWVSNHNVDACRQLVRMGVSARKVVPWDWPPVVNPADHPVKTLTPDASTRTVLFVGSITPTKGVGDVVAMAAELRRRGQAVRIRVVGRGDLTPFVEQADALGITGSVDFVGPLSHPDVVREVLAADLALVPSWHAYPEGVPMTIYETLATRTPLICSDHPAFRDRVGNGKAAVCVPERSPVALAEAVASVLTDPDRYRRMSEATAGVWTELVCPVTYYDVIRRWVSGRAEDDSWLSQYSLDTGRYDATDG